MKKVIIYLSLILVILFFVSDFNLKNIPKNLTSMRNNFTECMKDVKTKEDFWIGISKYLDKYGMVSFYTNSREKNLAWSEMKKQYDFFDNVPMLEDKIDTADVFTTFIKMYIKNTDDFRKKAAYYDAILKKNGYELIKGDRVDQFDNLDEIEVRYSKKIGSNKYIKIYIKCVEQKYKESHNIKIQINTDESW